VLIPANSSGAYLNSAREFAGFFQAFEVLSAVWNTLSKLKLRVGQDAALSLRGAAAQISWQRRVLLRRDLLGSALGKQVRDRRHVQSRRRLIGDGAANPDVESEVFWGIWHLVSPSHAQALFSVRFVVDSDERGSLQT